ncbi:hypothetical protein NTE14_005427 [Vibrio harveyi]|nr:hypothetical protein [Vibrio harveyi]
MSQVSYKIPLFMTLNGEKICYLIDYHRYVELREMGKNDSEILAVLPADKEAA